MLTWTTCGECGVSDGWKRDEEKERCEGRIPSQATNVKTWCIDWQEIKPSFQTHTHTRTHRMAPNRSMGRWRLLCGEALKALANKPYGWQTAAHLQCVCVWVFVNTWVAVGMNIFADMQNEIVYIMLKLSSYHNVFTTFTSSLSNS